MVMLTRRFDDIKGVGDSTRTEILEDGEEVFFEVFVRPGALGERRKKE